MKLELDDLDALCAYINERIVPGDQPGTHCDGTPRYTREFLQRCEPSREHQLEDYLTAGQGFCDCSLLLNYPGQFHQGHDEHCAHCGDVDLLTRDRVHGKGPVQ